MRRKRFGDRDRLIDPAVVADPELAGQASLSSYSRKWALPLYVVIAIDRLSLSIGERTGAILVSW